MQLNGYQDDAQRGQITLIFTLFVGFNVGIEVVTELTRVKLSIGHASAMASGQNRGAVELIREITQEVDVASAAVACQQ